jgi:hypothetical protein
MTLYKIFFRLSEVSRGRILIFCAGFVFASIALANLEVRAGETGGSFAKEDKTRISADYRGASFSPRKHQEMNRRALEKIFQEMKLPQDEKFFKDCMKILKCAQWYQDIFYFFKAKAHFDNCCFAEGINHINRRLETIEKEFRKIQIVADRRKRARIFRKMLFNAGRIAHSIQDFYAHSNYVELMQETYLNAREVPPVELWTPAGQKRILNLSGGRLISGKTFYTFPRRCPPGAVSHKKLSKDSARYIAGKKATRWINSEKPQNYNGFEAAALLAEQETYHFLRYFFERYSSAISLESSRR